MLSIREQIKKIPQNSGIYIFKDKSGNILYVGKAAKLKSRVASYFGSKQKDNRPIMSALNQVKKIETKITETVLEALILESNLIKKYQPKFNIEFKDDKSFSYAVVTKEVFPRVLVMRETEIEKKKPDLEDIFGPYISRKQLETGLKIIRKIFPYHSKKEKTEKGCLDFQIGLCPGPYEGKISKKNYRKNITKIKMILRGKKRNLIRKLEKDMKNFSKEYKFEKAAEIRNQIFALNHIQDIALLDRENDITLERKCELKNMRIEAYDISNISGKHAVGSMVVFRNYEPQKSQYRRFRIKNVKGINDISMMAEVLFRRFRNNWSKPDLIFLDGGKGHLNMAEKILKELKIKIPIIAVAKGPTRKVCDFKFIASEQFPYLNIHKKIIDNRIFIGQIISEAHRFAISYHRKVRKENFPKK